MSAILFKSLSEDLESKEEDPYFKLLRSEKINVELISSLDFEYNIKSLPYLQENNIIFTSPRALKIISKYEYLPDILNRRCFVVGLRTFTEAKNLGFNPEGEESGNSANLVNYIIKSEVEGDFAFITGNPHKTTIKDCLQGHGIVVNEYEVYKSLIRKDICETFTNILQEPGGKMYAVVLFSPQIVKFISSTLILFRKSLIIIAIGLSTAEELVKSNIQVDSVCQSPTPNSLIDSIKSKLHLIH